MGFMGNNYPSPKVPCTSAQRVRLGCLEECGGITAGTTDREGSKSTPSWMKNCSRQAWNMFYRMNLGWKVKLSTYEFDPGDGDVISLPYLAPRDVLEYLLGNHPDAVVGGVPCPIERAHHLESFWAGYKQSHPNHPVFEVHKDNLQTVVPVCYHGDEGRGKRRGNTVVVSMEAAIGIYSQRQSKKRKEPCGCNPPMDLKRKYTRKRNDLLPRHQSRLSTQTTNMKGHSFLQHWVLFVIPSVYHHAYPQLLMEMLQVIGHDLRSLFYDGLTVKENSQSNAKNYCIACCGHKGDLKWFTKVAQLNRSYEHQGRVRNLMCCHECLAGGDNTPWEDFRAIPSWAPTRYGARPWDETNPPFLVKVPFDTATPERQLKRDVFHTCKVGTFRDHVGSSICYMVHVGLFGTVGDFESKLKSAHGAFVLWARTIGVSPALRSFSRNLFMYKNFEAYPYINCKGSDTMLCLRWLVLQCVAFANDNSNGADREYLKLIQDTSKAALAMFALMNSHGLCIGRECAMELFTHITRYINGFNLLANRCLNDQWNLWGLKPKLHLLKHQAYDLHELLESGTEIFINPNMWNAEQNEDFIGRICRLSRRFDSRHVCRRVIQSSLLKASLLHRRFVLHSPSG